MPDEKKDETLAEIAEQLRLEREKNAKLAEEKETERKELVSKILDGGKAPKPAVDYEKVRAEISKELTDKNKVESMSNRTLWSKSLALRDANLVLKGVDDYQGRNPDPQFGDKLASVIQTCIEESDTAKSEEQKNNLFTTLFQNSIVDDPLYARAYKPL